MATLIKTPELRRQQNLIKLLRYPKFRRLKLVSWSQISVVKNSRDFFKVHYFHFQFSIKSPPRIIQQTYFEYASLLEKNQLKLQYNIYREILQDSSARTAWSYLSDLHSCYSLKKSNPFFFVSRSKNWCSDETNW